MNCTDDHNIEDDSVFPLYRAGDKRLDLSATMTSSSSINYIVKYINLG